jgi:hypothetical protein
VVRSSVLPGTELARPDLANEELSESTRDIYGWAGLLRGTCRNRGRIPSDSNSGPNKYQNNTMPAACLNNEQWNGWSLTKHCLVSFHYLFAHQSNKSLKSRTLPFSKSNYLIFSISIADRCATDTRMRELLLWSSNMDGR